MLSLLGDGSDVTLASGGFFLACGTHLHATVATVKADAITPVVVVYSGVVNVAIARDVHGAYRLMVGKVAVVPAAAFVAVARIAVAVVDTAVKPDFCSPIAFVEYVVIVIVTPVAGRLVKAHFGSHDPCSGNPIIISVSLSPVTGGPDIAIPRGDGLIINGQLWRGDSNRYRYADLGGGCRGDGQQYECEKEPTNGENNTHCSSFCLIMPW